MDEWAQIWKAIREHQEKHPPVVTTVAMACPDAGVVFDVRDETNR